MGMVDGRYTALGPDLEERGRDREYDYPQMDKGGLAEGHDRQAIHDGDWDKGMWGSNIDAAMLRDPVFGDIPGLGRARMEASQLVGGGSRANGSRVRTKEGLEEAAAPSSLEVQAEKMKVGYVDHVSCVSLSVRRGWVG
jgi:hypothetical protein